MAKKTQSKRATKPATAKPASQKVPDRLPFLTADDVPHVVRFKILPNITIYQRPDRTTALFLSVQRASENGGGQFTWSVNAGSPDRISLQDKLGRNLLAWAGQVIELYPQVGGRGGRFVNFYDPERAKQRTAAAAPPVDDDIPF